MRKTLSKEIYIAYHVMGVTWVIWGDTMPVKSNLRVVISCVSFETIKIIEPIRHYKADRVYLLHKGGKEPYDAFINEVDCHAFC